MNLKRIKRYAKHTKEFIFPIIVAAIILLAFFFLNPKVEMSSASENGITVFYEKGTDWKNATKEIISDEPIALKEHLLSGPREENSAIGYLAAQITTRLSQKGRKSSVFGEVIDETDPSKRFIGCAPENDECKKSRIEIVSGNKNAIIVEKSAIVVEGQAKWITENAESIAKTLVQ